MTARKYFLIIIPIFFSCTFVKNLAEIKKKKASVYSYTVNSQNVKYIPMHHLGKVEFYEAVKCKVLKYKNQGFKVYYEMVIADPLKDSLQNDIAKRKVRKIKGFNGTYKDVVQKVGVFKKYVLQPSNQALGTDTNDIRADLTGVQLIDEWEKQNGIIILDSIDLNTNFVNTYTRKRFYTNKQRDKIIVAFRNQYLMNMIKEKGDSNVLILYGAGHRKDLEKIFLKQ